jgi:hypothetical protein
MDAGVADPLLVLITEIDELNACASVMVLSPEAEMGSESDLVLPRDVSGLPYDLIVLPDVVGPAWFVQLGPAVSAANVVPASLSPAGIALRDMADSRWTWKETQLDALVALTAECRYQLLDGEPATIADPAAFDLSVVGIKERTCMTLATVRLLGTRSIQISTTALRVTPVAPASAAYESFVALSQTIQRYPSLVIRDAPTEADVVHIDRDLVDDPLPRAVSALLEKLDESVRCIRIASVSSLWSKTNPNAEPGFFELMTNGKRHQVVITNVDFQEACCV